VGGCEFLVDPGTFAYHTEPEWRAYFRGTSAHNTIRIDGEDQSQQGGNFMWLRKARATCSKWSTDAFSDTFEGSHDGYTALEDPVTHRRRIELEKPTRRIVIEDSLEMRGEHEVELFFHCHEDCEVLEGGKSIALTRGGRTLTMWLPEGGEVSVVRGSEEPKAGWVSRSFDRKHPAPTIIWRARLAGTTTLRTEIAA
jgi:uncharacterized heparinase superfamily protein